MPYCSDCGEEVGADVRFCPNCGSEIRASSGDASTGGGRTGQGGQAGQGGQRARGGQADKHDPEATGTQRSQGGGSRGDGQSRSGGQSRQGGGTGQAGGTRQGGQSRRGGQGSQEVQSTRGAEAAGGTGAQAGQTTGGGAGTAGATGATAATAAAGATDAEPVEETGQAGTNPEGPMPFESGAFGHAFGYATQDDYDAVLIGAVIEFVGAFIPFVNLIVRGYGLRLARASARGQVERPEWGDYGGMFVDGIKILALALAFGLLWTTVGGVLGGGLFLLSETAGTIVFFLVMFVASLLFPASLVTYAAQDSFGAAFSPSNAGAFLTSLSYVKAYVITSLISPLYLLVLFLSLFTIIGVFVVAAWGTYFFGSLWGYYYREAVAAGSAPPAPADPVNPAD